MKAVRKKDTQEMVRMWDPGEGEPSSEVSEGEEFVEIPQLTMEEALSAADRHAGGRAGRIFVRDRRVEGEPAAGPPSLADELREARRARGVRADAPVTLDELGSLERRLRDR